VSATVLTQNSNCFSVWATSLNDPSRLPLAAGTEKVSKDADGDIFPIAGHFRTGMVLLTFKLLVI
jgi:hypothetical protein